MTSLRFLPEQIEQWAIARLKPYERNPRIHSDDQVAKGAASIASYGWTVPLLVTADGEVIAGHGRLLAAQHLGLTEVPVIRLFHLSAEQVRAYRVADNQLVLPDDRLVDGRLTHRRAVRGDPQCRADLACPAVAQPAQDRSVCIEVF